MKVILTTKKEKTNIKQITDLLNLILFDYNVVIEEKDKTSKKKNVRKTEKIIIESKKETSKTVVEKHRKVTIKELERRKRKKEWLEDYYSQSKEKDEIDKLVNYYSNTKRIANNY